MKIFVIADEETTLAFALAGIKGQAVHSPTEVPAVLNGLGRSKTSLVLITEALAQENQEAIERMLLEPGSPLVIEVPDTEGPRLKRAGATERIVSLLRR